MSFRARRVSGTGVEPFDWGAYVSHSSSEPSAPGSSQHAAATRPDGADDQARLSAIERDAFAKGYAQGERAGAEAAAKRGEAMLRRLTETLGDLGSLRAEMIRRTERQIVQLAMAIAKRILGREIDQDRGLLVAMARVALDHLGEQTSATIRLHPDDYAVVAGASQSLNTGEQVRVVADPVVSRGGCLVQSDYGFMNVGMDAQFDELARTLLGENDVEPGRDAAIEPQHAPIARR
jgi:flagellar assembly protein FliH